MDKYRILVKGIVQCQDHYLVVEKWYDDRIFDPLSMEPLNFQRHRKRLYSAWWKKRQDCRFW